LDKQPLLGFFISFFPFFSSSKNPKGKKKDFFEGGKDFEQKVVTNSTKKLRKTRFSNKNFEKISYEEIGLFPRSFSRVFDRFVKQLFYDVENLVVQEYRFYRYLFLTTVKCVFLFLFFPLFVNFLAKNYLVRPLTEYLWNTKQSQIFLNAYQQKHAFAELKYFEEKLYFESLVLPNLKTEKQSESLPLTHSKNPFPYPSSKNPSIPPVGGRGGGKVAASPSGRGEQGKGGTGTPFPLGEGEVYLSLAKNFPFIPSTSSFPFEGKGTPVIKNSLSSHLVVPPLPLVKEIEAGVKKNDNSNSQIKEIFSSSNEELGKKNRIAALQLKTVQLAMTYNSQSIEAITNFFADLISVISFFYLLVAMEIPINISKSFLLEVFFGLDDSKKSLLILLVTDLLVGYHSDGPWAIFFESLFNHYGLPESQTGIFLLVATLPVLLDVLFKYLIFRHLNRASPATVATYHAMIE